MLFLNRRNYFSISLHMKPPQLKTTHRVLSLEFVRGHFGKYRKRQTEVEEDEAVKMDSSLRSQSIVKNHSWNTLNISWNINVSLNQLPAAMNLSQRTALKLIFPLNLKTQCPQKPWWTESMSFYRWKQPPVGLMSIGHTALLLPFTEDKSRVEMEKDSPDRHKGNRPTQTWWHTHSKHRSTETVFIRRKSRCSRKAFSGVSVR